MASSELRLTIDLNLSPEPAAVASIWAAAGIQVEASEVCRMLLLAHLAEPLDERGWQGAALIVGSGLDAVAPEPPAEPEPEPAETVAFAQMAAAFAQPVPLERATEPEPILIEDDDQPNSELPPRQQTEEGVATQETTRQPEAADAVSEADATGVASSRCSGSEGADDRPQQSLQAKPELPPAVEVFEAAEGGGVPPEPEAMPEAAADPDWLALIDRVEAGESIASVARSAGVDGRALGGKVTARRRMLKPAGPAPEAVAIPAPEPVSVEPERGSVEPEPVSVEPEEEEEDDDEPHAPAAPEAKGEFWTPQRDLALVVAMVGGRGSYAASQQLGCKPPDCVNRFKALLPQPGTVAQQELIKRLRALVEAEAGHGA